MRERSEQQVALLLRSPWPVVGLGPSWTGARTLGEVLVDHRTGVVDGVGLAHGDMIGSVDAGGATWIRVYTLRTRARRRRLTLLTALRALEVPAGIRPSHVSTLDDLGEPLPPTPLRVDPTDDWPAEEVTAAAVRRGDRWFLHVAQEAFDLCVAGRGVPVGDAVRTHSLVSLGDLSVYVEGRRRFLGSLRLSAMGCRR